MLNLEEHSVAPARVCQSTEIAEGKHAVPAKMLGSFEKEIMFTSFLYKYEMHSY